MDYFENLSYSPFQPGYLVDFNILEVHDVKSESYKFANIIYFVYFLIITYFKEFV